MPLDESDEPRMFATRLSEPAEAEIEAAHFSLMRSTSPSFADRWHDGLFEAIDSLALFPKRYAIIPESARFQMPVRRMNYGRGRNAYQVLYHLTDEDGDGQEDTVHILHVRHSSQPLSGEADADEGQA